MEVRHLREGVGAGEPSAASLVLLLYSLTPFGILDPKRRRIYTRSPWL